MAKNAGLDDKDKSLLLELQAWLGAVALTRQRRRVEKDRLLLTLTDYNRPRLEFYVFELVNSERVGNHGPIEELQDKCRDYSAGPTKSDSSLTDIIADAYLLRYKTPPQIRPRVMRLIALLTRTGAAWETLQEFAMHHALCKSIESHGVEASELIKIPSIIIKSELEGLQQSLSSKICMGNGRKPWKHLALHSHAEIQLLLFWDVTSARRTPRNMYATWAAARRRAGCATRLYVTKLASHRAAARSVAPLDDPDQCSIGAATPEHAHRRHVRRPGIACGPSLQAPGSSSVCRAPIDTRCDI